MTHHYSANRKRKRRQRNREARERAEYNQRHANTHQHITGHSHDFTVYSFALDPENAMPRGFMDLGTPSQVLVKINHVVNVEDDALDDIEVNGAVYETTHTEYFEFQL